MTIGIVLGNGKSRLAVDLTMLRSQAKVFGCNALYREFTPDVLVATDPEIATAIQESGYSLNNVFYTRKPIEGLGAKLITRNYGYSSGPVALTLAVGEGLNKIFMVGFDLDSTDGKFNNVYAGTDYYKQLGTDPTHWGNWERQVSEIVKSGFSQVVRVNDNNISPLSWKGLVREVSMQAFLDAINNCKLEAL